MMRHELKATLAIALFALALTFSSDAFAQCVGNRCSIGAYTAPTASPCAPCARSATYSCGPCDATFAPLGGFFRNLFGGRVLSACTPCASACGITASPCGRVTSTCSGSACEYAPEPTDAETKSEEPTKYEVESVGPCEAVEATSESCEDCDYCEDCEAVGPCDAVGATELESRLIDALNAARVRFRIRACLADKNLLGWARYNSSVQASYCRLGHFSGRSYEIAGEGYATPEAAVNGWLGSAPHRAILLNCGLSRIGASVYRGSNGKLYWTANFQ